MAAADGNAERLNSAAKFQGQVAALPLMASCRLTAGFSKRELTREQGRREATGTWRESGRAKNIGR
jgi:hypothetical protein